MEIWKDIAGYEGRYKVSTHGRVKSLDRVIYDKCGKPRKLGGKILRQLTSETLKYPSVKLSTDGVVVSHTVHRLVAEAFIPNPENYPNVLHYDDNELNNSIDNLRWGTYSDNMADRLRNGRHHFASRDRCSSNHIYTDSNTRVDKKGNRHCRQCKRESYHRNKIKGER